MGSRGELGVRGVVGRRGEKRGRVKEISYINDDACGLYAVGDRTPIAGSHLRSEGESIFRVILFLTK